MKFGCRKRRFTTSVAWKFTLKRAIFLPVLFTTILAGTVFAAPPTLRQADIGGASVFSYNSAWAETTSNDFRLGFGAAAKADFNLGSDVVSVVLNVTKSQLVSQRIDGNQNTAICSEGYFPAIVQMPGPCSMIQVRLNPLYWLGSWGLGISLTYNYFSDFTFYGAQIYNTRRSSQALGPVAAYKWTWGRFTLMAAAHFDYQLFGQTPLATSAVKSLQAGVTLYAMYAIF